MEETYVQRAIRLIQFEGRTNDEIAREACRFVCRYKPDEEKTEEIAEEMERISLRMTSFVGRRRNAARRQALMRLAGEVIVLMHIITALAICCGGNEGESDAAV